MQTKNPARAIAPGFSIVQACFQLLPCKRLALARLLGFRDGGLMVPGLAMTQGMIAQ